MKLRATSIYGSSLALGQTDSARHTEAERAGDTGPPAPAAPDSVLSASVKNRPTKASPVNLVFS